MVKRHELRESVFKLLFQLENSGMSLENIFNLDEEESYDAYVKDTVT
ncbi:transcription antitermination factor NusB, partial [Streptococcus danieliae]|nr:transcription antitermination factor NusB [Streptococcus danieliae]